MVDTHTMKQIVILGYLSDPMLERLSRIIDLLRFEPGDVLFRQDEPADRFYMMVRGNVLLEQRISEDVTACVGSIKPGFSFGWSAMIDDAAEATYTVDAICVDPSEVLSFRREKIRILFDEDPEMGHRFYKRLLVIIKKRLDYRTEQFRQAIRNHPEMQNLFCT